MMEIRKQWRIVAVLVAAVLCSGRAALEAQQPESKMPRILVTPEGISAAGLAGRDYFLANESILIEACLPCGAAYAVRVDGEPVADVAAEVGGLDDVVGLVSLVRSPDPAKGLEALDTIGVDDTSVEMLLRRLVTAEGASDLLADLRRLEDLVRTELKAAEEKRDEYIQRVDDWKTRLTPLSCDSSEKGLGTAVACLTKELDDATTPVSCSEFSRAVSEANNLLKATRAHRRSLVEHPLTAFPETLKRDAEAARTRRPFVRDYLSRVSAAVAIAKQTVGNLTHVQDRELSEPFFVELERLATLAGQKVSRVSLEELAENYAVVSRAEVQSRLTDLTTLLAKKAEGCTADCSVLFELDRLSKLSVADSREELSEVVGRFNDDLRALVKGLGRYRRKSRQPKFKRSLPPVRGNHDLEVRLLESKSFSLPDLSGLDDLTAEFSDAKPAGGPTVVTEADAGKLIATGSFAVHKIRRYNIGGGLVSTSLGETDHVVRRRPKIGDDGVPVVDANGAQVTEPFIDEAGSDSYDLAAMLAIQIYAGRGMDLYPSPGAGRGLGGFLLGFSLKDSADSVFLGGFYQPMLGMQVVGGVHFGKLPNLEQGFERGDALPEGTTVAPVRDEWEEGAFLGITFDARIFKSFFAGG